MINACCNLYFCFIITVHGDIRHLEMAIAPGDSSWRVHGDIRHLEIPMRQRYQFSTVHGDIRHLEIVFNH